jgi:hypothetical protein
MGEDCARHPLIGNIVSNNGVPAEQQTRDYLLSLYNATFHKIAGRSGDFTADDLREWSAKLAEWHKTNTVSMPSRIVGHPIAVGLDDEAKRQAHMAKQYTEQKLRDEEAAAAAQQLRDAEAAAVGRSARQARSLRGQTNGR